MKLRLFALRDTAQNTLVPDASFSDKKAAKAARDELNNGTSRYVVTPGPDHRNFRSKPADRAGK